MATKKTTEQKAAEAEAAIAEEVKEEAQEVEAVDNQEPETPEEPEMSQTARTYQRYYEKGFWNKKMLKNMVIKGKITEKEYEIITGEAYA